MSLAFGEKTLVMGILNVTPDSFYDGGRYSDPPAAVDRAAEMVREGADIIDIGGESTRPGALPVSAEEEMDRVCPVIEAVTSRFSVVVSVDTYKAVVAREAVRKGAAIVNDISGFTFDGGMASTVAECGCYAVIMHTSGAPVTMQQNVHYDNVVAEVYARLQDLTGLAVRAGVKKEKIIVDPGIGFGKTLDNNYEIIFNLNCFRRLGFPVLIGLSRKSLLRKLYGDDEWTDLLLPTVALNAIAAERGADIVRVHDVRPHVAALRPVDMIKRCGALHGCGH